MLNPSDTFRVPIEIRSNIVDGHVFNLTRIVKNIGVDKNTAFIREGNTNSEARTKNVSALLNIVLKMGGAHGPLANIWRSKIDDDHFQNWYLEKCSQRSASSTQSTTMSHRSELHVEKARDYRSNLVIDNLPSNAISVQPMTKTDHHDHQFNSIYGHEKKHTHTSISSESSASEIELQQMASFNPQRSSSTMSIHKNNNESLFNRQYQTIVDDRSTTNHHQQVTTFQPSYDDTQQILSDYQQFLREHPDVNNDPNPQIIMKPNPDQYTYQQNVSVRYLVPPTPPPPGPLIIRGMNAWTNISILDSHRFRRI
jgi:hypothetical protein